MNATNMDEIASPLPPLSQDLAIKDPHTFKQSLINQLQKDHPLAGGVWNLLSSQQSYTVADIELDVTTWSCEIHDHSISLGVSPIPDDIKQTRMFKAAEFTYADESMYRFTHELTHQFVTNMRKPKQMSNLFTAAAAMRETPPHRGLTMRGFHEFYKDESQKIKGVEDILELTTMYLWNPDYLRQFLSLLTDTDGVQFRQQFNLKQLSSEIADVLFTNIQSSVVDELKITN